MDNIDIKLAMLVDKERGRNKQTDGDGEGRERN